jgi:hypothetical protein
MYVGVRIGVNRKMIDGHVPNIGGWKDGATPQARRVVGMNNLLREKASGE